MTVAFKMRRARFGIILAAGLTLTACDDPATTGMIVGGALFNAPVTGAVVGASLASR